MKYKRVTVFKIPFWTTLVWILIANVIFSSVKGELLISSVYFVSLVLSIGFQKLFDYLKVEHSMIDFKKTIKEED